MKHLLGAVVELLLCVNITQAQTSDSLATIVFYRPGNFVGSAVSCRLIDSAGNMIRIYNHSYYQFKCKPGLYVFKVKGQKNDVYVDVDSAGGIYYYKITPLPGFWTMTWNVEQVFYKRSYDDFMNTQPNDMSKPLSRYNKRVGATFAGGPGFSDAVMMVTKDDVDVTFGFGGGVCFGGNFGVELNKYLDIEAGYNYRKRGLTPRVKNASMEFTGHQLYFMPSLIIPLDGGYRQRLKLGVGVVYAMENKLSHDTKSIPGGIRDDWSYMNSLGYQIRLLYEFNVSNRVTFNYGLRYYDLNYKYETSRWYYPTTSTFSSPKGNGLDIMFGLGFHF